MKKRTGILAVVVMLITSLFFVSWVDTGDTSQVSSQNGYTITNDNSIVDTKVPGEEYMFLAGPGKEDNYIPEMKLLVSTDKGESWTENTKNLKMGQSFYLMFEAYCLVPGIRLQTFGAKKIDAFIAIPKDSIIDFSIQDAKTNYLLVEKDVNDPEGFDMIIFDIPTSPLNEAAVARGSKPRTTELILSCTAKKRGSQQILVPYEDRVDSMYTKTFTLVFN